MNSNKEIKNDKIYCDYKQFKGNTFETNINSINNLLLGKAQRISNTQFIYVDESDGKNYISANYFIIRLKGKDDKEGNMGNEIKMCYPHNFIYSIFFYDNKFFYVNKNNNLLIFKLEENNVTKYVFAQKEENKDQENNDTEFEKEDEKKNDINKINKPEEVNIEESAKGKEKENNKFSSEVIKDKKDKKKDKLNNISEKKDRKKEKDKKDTSNKTNDKKNEKDKEKEFQYEQKSQTPIIIVNNEEFENKIKELVKIKDSNLNERYELLINILKNYLKEELQSNSPKNINKIIKINFDDIENCEIKYCRFELDCTGIIQEPLNLQKGKTNFKDGISDLITFIKNKRDKNFIDNTKIDNTFKAPIIFKNFEEESIPPKESIICEIKSGFDIKTLKSQIKERINIVNDCLFDNYKPSYYIGIVNINDTFVDKLNDFINILDTDFIFKEKIIILATINYLYCGIDASYEVHTDYILYKKLNNMYKGIKGRFCTVFILFFIIFILLLYLKNDINSMKSGMNSMKNDINSMKNGMVSMKNDINSMKNDINSMKNDINNKMEQRFKEFYQILIDAKKNDNALLNTKKSFNPKAKNIPEDVCYPKEL